jgi:hypothetical protein
MMYYDGNFKRPSFLKGNFQLFNSPNRQLYASPIHAYRYDISKPDTLLQEIANIFPAFYDSASNKKLIIPAKNIPAKTVVFFIQGNNLDYAGMGEIESSGSWGSLIRYCSPGLKNGISYRVFKYK